MCFFSHALPGYPALFPKTYAARLAPVKHFKAEAERRPLPRSGTADQHGVAKPRLSEDPSSSQHGTLTDKTPAEIFFP
jgi:hypothetical protein